jgi:putative DNA-invertase from lambdoid prophage Rac
MIYAHVALVTTELGVKQMARIAYYRCSTADQSVAAQRDAMGSNFDREFSDEAVSGAVQAAKRPEFAKLLSYVREGDVIHTYAVDRLGRDAIDVQTTVQTLFDRGVAVEVKGLGRLSGDAGKLILAVLSQLAEMERRRIRDRCETGRVAAKAALEKTGRTHRGKESLGRPKAQSADAVIQWRKSNAASIGVTARHFGISDATVKRYCSGRMVLES